MKILNPKNWKSVNKIDSGFTLIELLVALTLLLILCGVVAPSFFSNFRKAKDETSIRKGALLDVAKTSYRADVGEKIAQNGWSGKTDEERYQQILRNYLVAPPQLLGDGITTGQIYYTPAGYQFSLGNSVATNTITYRLDGGVKTKISP